MIKPQGTVIQNGRWSKATSQDFDGPFVSSFRITTYLQPRPAASFSISKPSKIRTTFTLVSTPTKLDLGLGAKGYHLHNSGGDGNCLFRSISFVWYGTEAHHMHVRTLICEHLERYYYRHSSGAARGLDASSVAM